MRQTANTSSWKKNVFEGLVLLACAPVMFWYFTDFENSHDPSRHINWVVAILYNIGGKWLVCAVVLGLAISEFAAARRKRLMQ